MNKVVLVFPLILLSLLAGIWNGWIRIGWNFPITMMAAQHGGLMVNSFLASLIFLERSVSFRQKWVLLLPFVNAFSVIAFVFGSTSIAQLLFVVGSGGFIVMCLYFVFRFKEAYYYIFFVGACCLLIGNTILFKTGDYRNSVTWWMGFLLFTIVAERLELSRFLSLSRFQTSLLWMFLVIVCVGLLLPFNWAIDLVAFGVALVAAWLLKYDMARRSVKVKGQHRYSGLLLIIGYVWLVVMSILMPLQDRIAFGYDAVLHSFFIGFIFSMIFSHAVIILPAITRLRVKLYRPVLYVWFGLLQISLIIRIVADIIGDVLCRKIGGMLNGISILMFLLSIVVITVSEVRKGKAGANSALKHRMGLA